MMSFRERSRPECRGGSSSIDVDQRRDGRRPGLCFAGLEHHRERFNKRVERANCFRWLGCDSAGCHSESMALLCV